MEKIKFIIICFAVFQLFSCKNYRNYTDDELKNFKNDGLVDDKLKNPKSQYENKNRINSTSRNFNNLKEYGAN